LIERSGLHAQGDHAPVHERGAHIDVIAFGEADLVNDQEGAFGRQPFQCLSEGLGVVPFDDDHQRPVGGEGGGKFAKRLGQLGQRRIIQGPVKLERNGERIGRDIHVPAADGLGNRR
jgi:hypothetical protein